MAEHKDCKHYDGCGYRNDIGCCPNWCAQFKHKDDVRVVRCKDCVHSFWDEENEMWKCVESAEYDSDYGDYIGFVEYHNEDFFCGYGERRTDEIT